MVENGIYNTKILQLEFFCSFSDEIIKIRIFGIRCAVCQALNICGTCAYWALKPLQNPTNIMCYTYFEPNTNMCHIYLEPNKQQFQHSFIGSCHLCPFVFLKVMFLSYTFWRSELRSIKVFDGPTSELNIGETLSNCSILDNIQFLFSLQSSVVNSVIG